MLTGFTEMQTVTTITGAKIAIVGEPGSGKSWLAASCADENNQAIVWDFDGRRDSIRGKKGVSAKTVRDIDFPNRIPKAWTEFKNDITELELLKQNNNLKHKWFICDSMTYMCGAAMNYMLYNEPALRRKISVGNNLFCYVPHSFDAYKAEQSEIMGTLSRLFELGNVIATFHTGPERAPEWTQTNPKFTGRLTVEPPRCVDLLALFNDQWLCRAISAGNYEVQTQPNYTFAAKTIFKLNEIEKPDIRAMISKSL